MPSTSSCGRCTSHVLADLSSPSCQTTMNAGKHFLLVRDIKDVPRGDRVSIPLGCTSCCCLRTLGQGESLRGWWAVRLVAMGQVFLVFNLVLAALAKLQTRTLFPTPSSARLHGKGFLCGGTATKRVQAAVLPTSKSPSRSCQLRMARSSVLVSTTSTGNMFCTHRTLRRLTQRKGKGVHYYQVCDSPRCA